MLEQQPRKSTVVDHFWCIPCIQFRCTTGNSSELFHQKAHYRYKHHIGRVHRATEEEQKECSMHHVKCLYGQVVPDSDLLESNDE